MSVDARNTKRTSSNQLNKQATYYIRKLILDVNNILYNCLNQLIWADRKYNYRVNELDSQE